MLRISFVPRLMSKSENDMEVTTQSYTNKAGFIRLEI